MPSLRHQGLKELHAPSPASSPSAAVGGKTSHPAYTERDPTSSRHVRAPAIVPSRTLSMESSTSSALWSTTSTVGDARDTRPHAHCSLVLTGRCVCTSGNAEPDDDEENEREKRRTREHEFGVDDPSHTPPEREQRVFHYYTLPNGAYREPKLPPAAAPVASTSRRRLTSSPPPPAPPSKPPRQPKAEPALTRSQSASRAAQPHRTRESSHSHSSRPSPQATSPAAGPLLARSPSAPRGDAEPSRQHESRQGLPPRESAQAAPPPQQSQPTIRRKAVPAVPEPSSTKPLNNNNNNNNSTNGHHYPVATPSPGHSLRRRKNSESLRRQSVADAHNAGAGRPDPGGGAVGLQRHASASRADGAVRPPRAAAPSPTMVAARKLKHTSAPLPVLIPPVTPTDDATGADASVQRSNTAPRARGPRRTESPGPTRVYNYYMLPDGGYRTPRASVNIRGGGNGGGEEGGVAEGGGVLRSPVVVEESGPTWYVTREPDVRALGGAGHARSASDPQGTAGAQKPRLRLPLFRGRSKERAPDDHNDHEGGDKRADGEEGEEEDEDGRGARRVPQPQDRSPYPNQHDLPPVTPTSTVPPHLHPSEGGDDDSRAISWVPPIVVPRGSGETPPGILLNRLPAGFREGDGVAGGGVGGGGDYYGFGGPRTVGRRRGRGRPGMGHVGIGIRKGRRPSNASETAVEEDGEAGKGTWRKVVGKVRAALDHALPKDVVVG